jgi:DHA3 family macrolide efflux protein-like MFS transporter
MIKALRHPQIQRLWIGQAFSSVGDEIYRVGLIWFAVSFLGSDTGYLAAGQTASLMLLSFIGGKWADHWHPLKTMVSVDLLRALIVLIPVVTSFFIPLPMAMLWAVALVLAALSAFFDPATQATIPLLAKDPSLRQATNGLMGTTIRMARMVGPAIVGLLSAFIPMIHFFTIDALTFCVSALSVYSLKRHLPATISDAPKKSIGVWQAITSGFHLIREKPGMSFIFFSKAVTTGPWNLALMIGFPLLVHQMTNGDAKSFGLVMASYGLGNFAGSVYFGNQLRKRLHHMLFTGYIWLGIGFVLIGVAPSLFWVIMAAALAGLSGPMNDLAFIDLMQRDFEVKDLTKVFRLRLAVEAAGTLVFTLLSPFMIKTTSVRTVIVMCGAIWVLVGAAGWIKTHRRSPELLKA